ncbi:hypothetical protein GCM10008111_22230 [Alishewanella tabrizica]|uniref:Uncharacterized protein n=2 Tax=Alishewanella tabrizica TaxID=671278 RepID=A0ABQ2WPY8_9ALTE|nr:hypothetical protein GCM10008111_22230 [Alishewanella tabrizica]
MLWLFIKESIPLQFLVTALVGIIFWLLGWSAIAIMAFVFTLELLFFKANTNVADDVVFSKDIFNLIKKEGDQLRVGMEVGSIKNIKLIKLWQQDEHGHIALTLNAHSSVRYKFPNNQYHPLLDWFKANLPEVELVTAYRF